MTLELAASTKHDTDDSSMDQQQQQKDQMATENLLSINIITPKGVVIELGMQSNVETPIVIKQYLLDVLDTSFYTSYVLEWRNGASTVQLNDFIELKSYFSSEKYTVADQISLHMVEVPYDVRSARLHLKRLLDIIRSPPVLRAAGSADSESPVDPHNSLSVESINISEEKLEAAARSLPSTAEVFGDRFLLDKFYEKTLFQVAGDAPDNSVASLLSKSISSITLSGWNPPPPARKMYGDLVYFEVVTANEGSFHVTGVKSGFYINKSTYTSFNPNPIPGNAGCSHELLRTIMFCSPSVVQAWDKLVSSPPVQGQRRHQEGFEDIANLSTIVAMHEAGKCDEMIQSQPWIYPPAPRKLDSADHTTHNRNHHETPTYHAYDMNRTQDDISSTFGADVTAPPREWNEEIQTVRSMPWVSSEEKLLRYRYLNKIVSEFIDACKAASVAVLDGYISPLNPMDPVDTHVFIYNNIFFSRAIDSKESFKLCEGNEACRKYAGLDLRNQRIIQSHGIEGLHTGMSAIIDYKGERLMAQTVIPGILSQGERSARLLYGCLEHGKKLTCKQSAMKVLADLAVKLHLVTRNLIQDPNMALLPPAKPDCFEIPLVESQSIRIDDTDDAIPVVLDRNTFQVLTDTEGIDEANTIKAMSHIGPIEGKLIEGSDGRVYILEFMRLTPRDANYVKGPKGTKCVDDKILDTVGPQLSLCYVLRQELFATYIQHIFQERRKKVIVDAMAKQQQAKDEKALTASEEAKALHEEQKGADSAFNLTPELHEQFKLLHEEVSSIKMNPNVFMHKDLAADIDPSIEAKDEEVASMMARFLINTLLPRLTEEIQSAELSLSDNQAMAVHLHSLGINMRYLGRLADLALEQEQEDASLLKVLKQRQTSMPKYWLEFLEIEMVARATKHLLIRYVNEDKQVRSAPACSIASMLSYLLGLPKDSKLSALAGDSTVETSGKKTKVKAKSSGSEFPFPFEHVADGLKDRGTFFSELKAEVFKRFGYSLSLVRSGVDVDDRATAVIADENIIFHQRISRQTLLRRVCQLNGIRIALVDYNLEYHTTESALMTLAASPPTKFSVSSFYSPFRPCDIIEMVPRIKSCEQECPVPESRDYVVQARNSLIQGNIESALELSQESIQWVQQVTSGMHREILHPYDMLVSALMHGGDMITAISVCGRSLHTSIQVTGFDSSETLQNHLHISFLLSEIGEYPEAMKHIQAARYIALLLGGESHPEMIGIIMKIAGIYKSTGKFSDAALCLKECHDRLSYCGDQLKHAAVLENLAQCYSLAGNDDLAIAKQKSALGLILQLFGEDHENSLTSQQTLTQLRRTKAEKTVALGRQKQIEDEAEKERQRLNWLEDDDLDNAKANGNANKVGAKKKKKNNKKK